MNIIAKKRTDDNTPLKNVKIQDLVNPTPQVKTLLERRRIFAIQENWSGGGGGSGEGEKRYARISIDSKKRLLLHFLHGQQEMLKLDGASLLKYEEIMEMVDTTSRLAFLELGAEGKTLGKLLIRLSPDTTFARQFAILCTGELGPSYANTNILKVMYKNKWLESIFFGDYERNDGEAGRALVPGADWTSEHTASVYTKPWVEGTVAAWGWSEEKASQFTIHSRTCTALTIPGCFGIVEEGMGVLMGALLRCPDATKIYIRDCGIVLSHHYSSKGM